MVPIGESRIGTAFAPLVEAILSVVLDSQAAERTMRIVEIVPGRWGLIAVATLTWAAMGCDGAGLTGPNAPGEPVQLSRDISLGELQDLLAAGPTRIEVELLSEGAIARELLVKNAEATADEEAVDGRVLVLNLDGDRGTLDLTAGMSIDFSADTRFSAHDRDEMSFGSFVERVQALIAEGHEPPIRARRGPPEAPQDPTDGSFSASSLHLAEGLESTEIEMNVDAGALELNANPQDGEPDGWITLLNTRIALLISDGITDLGLEGGEEQDEVEFEGHVHTVDLEAAAFSFGDGAKVLITDRTEIVAGDDAGSLNSLAAVKEALEAGKDVIAWGHGMLQSVEPTVIEAGEVHFALTGGDDEEGGTDIVEFEGAVISVDAEAGTFELKNGTIVRLFEESHIRESDHGLNSLAAVQEALQASEDVIAYGFGELEGVEPLRIAALEVTFGLAGGDGGGAVGFEGQVATVDLELSAFTLADDVETHVRLAEGSEIRPPAEGDGLESLAAVQEAREAGFDVIAYGEAEVESEEPLKLVAIWVTFVVAD